MSETFQPSLIDSMQADPTAVVDLISREQAVAEYHRMGPCYELKPEDAEPLLKLAATTLLEPKQGETAGELSARLKANLKNMAGIVANPGQKLEAASMMYDVVRALGATPEQVKAHIFSIDVLNFVMSLQTSVSNDSSSTRAQKVDAFMGVATSKDELLRRGVQPVKLAKTSTNERETVEDSEESWRVKALERVMEQRNLRIVDEQQGDGVTNGKLFEFAVMASLQFELWQDESEDANNYVRLSNEREDRPYPGIPANIGTKVSHDIVVVRDGLPQRLQAKCGYGARQIDPERYNLEVITLVIDDTSDATDFEEMILDVIDAYKGDDAAIGRVNNLLQRLRLQN